MRWIYLFLTMWMTTHLSAQVDSHYWTNQFGSKGLLLNGAVIASADDETAIYYNPGSIGQGDQLGFAFSFLNPSYSKVTHNNFLGDGLTFEDDHLGLAPSFAAVRFKPFRTDKIVASIATFSRFNTNIGFRDRVANDLGENAIVAFVGDLDFRRRISQQWFALGMSYNLTKNLGIGIAQYAVFHGDEFNLKFKKEIYPKQFSDQIFTGWRSEFNYDITASGGNITKLGLSWKSNNLSIGATFTTPVYGFLYKKVSYNVDDQKIFTIDSTASFSNRNRIDLNQYKSPMSVGLGMECRIEDFTVSLSAEYFSEIEDYNLFEHTDDSFNGSAFNSTPVSVSVNTANLSVLNFAIGIQRKVNENRTWIVGFRTDYNQERGLIYNGNTEYLANTPNVFHLSGGGLFKYKGNVISVGVDVGYGRRSGAKQLVDLTNITAENLFEFSGKENVTTNTNVISLFFTYDFLFARIKSVDDDN